MYLNFLCYTLIRTSQPKPVQNVQFLSSFGLRARRDAVCMSPSQRNRQFTKFKSSRSYLCRAEIESESRHIHGDWAEAKHFNHPKAP